MLETTDYGKIAYEVTYCNIMRYDIVRSDAPHYDTSSYLANQYNTLEYESDDIIQYLSFQII